MTKNNKNLIDPIDIEHLKIIRSTIDGLYNEFVKFYDFDCNKILDVAPEIYKGCKGVFKNAIIETLDINDKSGATYIADLANCDIVPSSRFDLIFCTEVLEHTNDPFSCAKSLKRIIKDNGIAVITTPFNFRIHNPLPDNWRFTEHGLRLIFKSAGFKKIDILGIESSRFLMPIQYVTRLSN